MNDVQEAVKKSLGNFGGEIKVSLTETKDRIENGPDKTEHTQAHCAGSVKKKDGASPSIAQKKVVNETTTRNTTLNHVPGSS